MDPRQMPPGMNPLGMPIIGQGVPQGGPPGGAPQLPSMEKVNPLPPGSQAMKTLRATADCPITKEAEAFKQIIPKLQFMKVDISGLLEIYGQGVATIIGSDNYCTHQSRSRTVVTFSEDPTLNQLHTDLQKSIMEMQQKMAELTELKQKIEKLATARWDRAVKETGLSPDKRFYQIDEEAGVIKQLDLDCVTCKGATRICKLRQKMADKMVHLEYEQKKEKDNDGLGEDDNGDGTSRENADTDRKTSTQEPQISSMANPATPDGGDGSDSSNNPTGS